MLETPTLVSQRVADGIRAEEGAADAVLERPEALNGGDRITGVMETTNRGGIRVWLDSGIAGFIPWSIFSVSGSEGGKLLNTGDRVDGAFVRMDKSSAIMDRRPTIWKGFAYKHRRGRYLSVEIFKEIKLKSGEKGVLVRVNEGNDSEHDSIVGLIRKSQYASVKPKAGDKLVVKVLKVRGKAMMAEFSLEILGN